MGGVLVLGVRRNIKEAVLGLYSFRIGAGRPFDVNRS